MDDLILIKYNDLIVLKCIRAVTGGGDIRRPSVKIYEIKKLTFKRERYFKLWLFIEFIELEIENLFDASVHILDLNCLI